MTSHKDEAIRILSVGPNSNEDETYATAYALLEIAYQLEQLVRVAQSHHFAAGSL